MTNKRYYAAVTIQENGKYYSYAIPFTSSDNVLCKFKIPNLINACICKSKKEAAETVTVWNDCFKNNGTYLFDTPAF